MFPKNVILVLVFLCCLSFPVWGINLIPCGNANIGYTMSIQYKGQAVVDNPGEFSLLLTNTDASITTHIVNWKAHQCEKLSDSSYVLSDTLRLNDFDAFLYIKVFYCKVNDHVVSRRVELFQTSVPKLYYILDELTRPAISPKQYVSFEHENHPVGFVHELFPAVGWETQNGWVCGVVPDNGYLNHYTRTTRRRNNGMGGGFLGMRKLPDVNLFRVTADGVAMRFGEYYDLDHSPVDTLPAYTSTITPMKNMQIYTIDFDCRGKTPLSLKLYRVNKAKQRIEELEQGVKYIDAYPTHEKEWTHFKGSIVVPYLEGDSVEMVMNNIEVKNFKILHHSCKGKAYNYIPQGEIESKTTYFFVDQWKSLSQFKVQSQKFLAEGKGFQGTLIEKTLYGNMQGVTWIRSIDDFSPFVVPNMNYAPDMYARDSYWSVISSYNKELNIGVWNSWAKTQTPAGAIGTIITPYMGSVEAKDNEATIEWLIWALLNKRRFNATLPQAKIDKAVQYVLNEFDSNKDGICESHFTLSQVDICEYNPKMSNLAVNQGMFAVALQTIQALGYTVDDAYIHKAEEAYRGFYDTQRKHITFDKRYPEILSLTDLVPEFLSLWLFNHPLLTDEMVCNEMDQVPLLNANKNAPHPELGTTAPICIRVSPKFKNGYEYLTEEYQPFEDFGVNYRNHARDGYYYNGGSWMRGEYCAYAVAYKHGWKNASKMMENRAWAEMNLNPDWPYSKEFIPTKWNTTKEWWLSTRGLCWNVFILMADELVGTRNPTMDPDYEKQNQ